MLLNMHGLLHVVRNKIQNNISVAKTSATDEVGGLLSNLFKCEYVCEIL